ncbi:MAG TPA: hypothetical protein VFT45_21245 [Longimicrobium sp.]|nr:hypothetical protein [Longimicrobium sp.]
MKKIRLRLDTLEVESFQPAAATKEARGTVNGYTGDLRCTTDCPTIQITCTEDTYQDSCYGASCDIYHLCADTRNLNC